jgi:Protein of unknown function (DUF3396)
MPNALTTVRTLHRAFADVELQRTAALLVKGSLDIYENELSDWWQWWRSTVYGRALTHRRDGSDSVWRPIVHRKYEHTWPEIFSTAHSHAAPRWLELTDQSESDSGLSSTSMTIYDLPAVMGLDRASLILLRLPDNAAPVNFTELGEVSLQLLPIWWGTAGWTFQYKSGRPDVAARRMAALARRYWCVQILNTTNLQWDALLGMPSVNWLTWIGPVFAAQSGTTLEALAIAAAAHLNESVFHRLTPNGLSVAAGPIPLKGDINLAENFRPYSLAAKLLQPLLLEKMSPLAGPFADTNVLDAWLHRFELPEEWLNANFDDE